MRSNMKDSNKEFSDYLVTNFKQIFFLFEIKKREQENNLEPDFELIADQVIFFPNGTLPLIRLNSEISANAKLKTIETETGEKEKLLIT